MTSQRRLIKRIHIAILIFCALLFALSSINTNIWFDECYSVAAVSNNVSDMVGVLTDDVHPFLYYFLLKAVHALTGGSIIAMRLFSALGMWLLCLTGYTHVRRYVSEPMGLFFSLFCALSPASIKYAGELRMYSYGALFVFLAAFYAYLTLRELPQRGYPVLFAVFAVCAAYSHYYGLVSVCVINAFFIVGAIIKKARVRRVLACCIAELALYIPGFAVFFIQSTRVASGDYWIRVKYPDVLLQTFTYIFTGGDSPWDCYMSTAEYTFICVTGCLLCAASIAALVCGVRRARRAGCAGGNPGATLSDGKEAAAETAVTAGELDDAQVIDTADKNEASDAVAARFAALAFGVFCGVVGAGLAVSVFKEFYYVRYTMLCHGLLLALYAYAASRVRRSSLLGALCGVLCASCVAVCAPFLDAMHNGDFARECAVLDSEFTDADALLFERITPGAVLSYMVEPRGAVYFINDEMDAYPRAYTAFSEDFETVPAVSELPLEEHRRVFILSESAEGETGDGELVAEFEQRFPSARRCGELSLDILYRHNSFRLVIFEFDS